LSKRIVTSIRVDRELWRKARIYALQKGLKIYELIETLLRKELEKESEAEVENCE